MSRGEMIVEADLAVIGAGLAGLAAAVFAAQAGLRTVVVGLGPGEMGLAPGLLDVLGLHPVTSSTPLLDPWAGLARLRAEEPRHPYARLAPADLKAALAAFLEAAARAGLDYWGQEEANVFVPTPVGRLKPTYRAPLTMKPAVEGLAQNRPAVLVGFQGQKEFSARQVADNLHGLWPNLRAGRVNFPFLGPAASLAQEPPTQLMAEALEREPVRAALAEAVEPLLNGVELVGFPAVLGLRSGREVTTDLAARLGRPVFEIPTFPPSVPGLRLRDGLTRVLTQAGVEFLWGRPAGRPQVQGRRVESLKVGFEDRDMVIRARSFLLATGRFVGQGLWADRRRVRETVFDLPVTQPESREDWHAESFWERRGHPLNRAGLQTDEAFRPLDRAGRPAGENLFAAGSILAHQDWVRQKCGAGLALGTAWAAVRVARA